MPISYATKDMLSMLPSWMEVQQEESTGAKFLNVSGEKIEELEAYIDEKLSNIHIGTANISEIDILYKVPINPQILNFDSLDIVGVISGEDSIGEHHEVKEVYSMYDFYKDDGVRKAIIDAEKKLCYFNNRYDYVVIQGIMHQDIIIHHVWNCFDEFGLLVGCPRLFGENNIEYKKRILDVFKKPGSANNQGIVNALSRELSIPSEKVKVDSLGDLAFSGTLLNKDGSPTAELSKYAEKTNEVMSITWGKALWDNNYWATMNDDNMGLNYLPHVWDVSTEEWENKDFKSGIGDGDDLLIDPPKRESDLQEFNYYVGLAGIRYSQKEVYPSHSLKFKVVAEGTVVSRDIAPQEYHYSVVASPKIPLRFKIKAEREFQQNPITLFDGDVFNNSDYDNLTEEQKRDSYIVSDENRIEIVDGSDIPNPSQRYVEIRVDMTSNEDQTHSPVVDDIILSWESTSGDDKTIIIGQGQGESLIGENYFVDFTSNTWNDNSPIIRVEGDDWNVRIPEGNHILLGYGDYFRVIDTQGDWNRSANRRNVVITEEGDLKLSID